MVVAFYFRLHLAYFPRPVVAIFARPEQRSLAQTSIRAELPSGNVPTTRVRRRISRFSRSITLLVRMRVQCSLGKSQ